MRTRGIATAILTLGLAGVALAAFLGSLSATVLSEPVLADTAAPMLETDRVRDPIRARTADALAVSVPVVATLDPPTRTALADAVLDQPVFVDGFADALGSVHRHAFDGEPGEIVIEPGMVRSATESALLDVVPEVAGAVPGEAIPLVTIDSDPIPHLDGWNREIRAAAIMVGVVSILAIGIALALGGAPIFAIARVGRMFVGTGLVVLVVFWAGPTLLLPFVGGWSEVGGIALGGNGALLLPALFGMMGGACVLYLADRLAKLQREHARQMLPSTPAGHFAVARRRTV